jgi:hypothetical protein
MPLSARSVRPCRCRRGASNHAASRALFDEGSPYALVCASVRDEELGDRCGEFGREERAGVIARNANKPSILE